MTYMKNADLCMLSPHSIQVSCKPIQINLSLRGVLLYLSILSIYIVSTTSSIATVPILSFKYSTEVFPCVSHCNVKRCPTITIGPIDVNSTSLYYILHSLTMILFFTRISSQRSEDSGYSDSSDSVPSYHKGSVHTVPYITTVYISPCHTRLHSSEHLTTNTRHTDTQHRWMNNETSDTKNMILEEKLVTKSNNTTNTRMNSITVLLE